MKRQVKRLALRRDTLRSLQSAQLARAAGGFWPSPTTAATDGNNGCASEATGCHTGLSGSRVVLKRRPRRLHLAAETVRQLRTAELAPVQGGQVAQSDECPSAHTYCYKYCSD